MHIHKLILLALTVMGAGLVSVLPASETWQREPAASLLQRDAATHYAVALEGQDPKKNQDPKQKPKKAT